MKIYVASFHPFFVLLWHLEELTLSGATSFYKDRFLWVTLIKMPLLKTGFSIFHFFISTKNSYSNQILLDKIHHVMTMQLHLSCDWFNSEVSVLILCKTCLIVIKSCLSISFFYLITQGKSRKQFTIDHGTMPCCSISLNSEPKYFPFQKKKRTKVVSKHNREVWSKELYSAPRTWWRFMWSNMIFQTYSQSSVTLETT